MSIERRNRIAKLVEDINGNWNALEAECGQEEGSVRWDIIEDDADSLSDLLGDLSRWAGLENEESEE